MFNRLSGKLSGVFDGLSKRGALSQEDVNEAMREIRLAMLDADVALPVVKEFVKKVQEKSVGQEVLHNISPGQAIAKIVNDALIDALG
ncbi:signal recognition particle receptor subunit alpha, partial [Bifidobacterium sp. M0353]|nr:signal recognition particle receptor subunit alpha [Bifidobacterium sp. M0353]